jgi:hypothetical protein
MFTHQRRMPLFIFVAGAALLAGCAQVPRQAFNAAAATHIKKVVVTHAPNQDHYQINIVGHPGMSFGLVGGLVAAADMHSKGSQLTKAIDPGETRVQERFGQTLSARLKSAGFEPEIVVLPRETQEADALALAKQRNPNDAVLLVDVSAGYWAAGPSSDYFPRLVAKVKAVDTKTEKILYEDTISYGYAMPQAQTVHLASEPTYRFRNMEELVVDPGRTRAGLYAGVEAVAQQIALDLKRP